MTDTTGASTCRLRAPPSTPTRVHGRAMAAVVGGRIDLELEVVDRLEVPVNGKERLVDQRIPGAATTWA